MPVKGTDEWKETYCDRRFHPPYLTGLPYWFFCRLRTRSRRRLRLRSRS